MYDDEQAEQIERVGERIGGAILEFFKREELAFHADDLRFFVRNHTGLIAPASADRIMRDMRQKGIINYRVVSRRKSLYEIQPKFDATIPYQRRKQTNE